MISALTTILSRPKTVLTLMLVMLAAGIATYISIPKEANPDIDVPIYYVSIGQQGVSPQDAERLLVRPMETELRGIDGLKELTAIASEGHAGIILEFDISSDKDQVIADVRDKVDNAKGRLPADADEPTISETNFALEPTIIVALSGDLPERTLFNYARRLKDEVEAISTVREANLVGNRDEVLEVIVDLTKLESYNITPTQLLTALNQNNVLIPAGTFDDGNGRFPLKVPGLVETAEDVFSIAIKQNGEGVVTIGDVANLQRSFKDAYEFTRVNGNPAITLEIVKRIGTNIIENNAEVKQVVEDFTSEWPESIQIDYLLDQSSFIFEVLGSFESSILTSILLVMIVVVGALGIKSGILVGFAIPTSFMIGFLILGSIGMTVNMMVMFGLVLCVGMLVDGAIVVTEYADRKLAEGVPPSEAYTRAAQLMFWPVVSSTGTTLAAFLPMLLWPGVPGEFMSYLPIMVIIVLSASLLTALIFLPTMGIVIGEATSMIGRNIGIVMGLLITAASGFMVFTGASQSMDQNTAIGLAAIVGLGLGTIVGWLVNRIAGWRRGRAKPIDTSQADMLSSRATLDVKKMKGFVGGYLRVLKVFTGNIVGNLVLIGGIVGLTIFVFSVFGKYSSGVEFFVEEEPDVAIVLISARGNLPATQIRDLVGEVEQQVLRINGIDNVVMTATAPGGGGGGGGPQVAGIQDKPADVVGELQIELADYCCRRKAVEIFEDIRTSTADIPGIKVETRKIEGGPPTGKDIRLEVKSTDYDTMIGTVAALRPFFDEQDYLTDQEDGRPLPGIEWELNVDREAAGRYGAGIAEIGTMVQLITNGVLVGTYRPSDSEDEVDIRVRVPENQRNLGAVEDLRLPTARGQVPLANFIDRQPVQKLGSITRKDGLYTMDIKATIATDSNGEKVMTIDEAVSQIETYIETQNIPENVFLKFRGADEEQQESGQFLMLAGIGALFLMFIILLTQFNSFYQTIITLTTVILAVVGVLIGMIFTGQKFSIIMTGTGVVALAGIVVNNAIVLIDTYNRLRSEGVTDIREAVLKTAAQRLRPILLTTVTTMLGLLPMAMQINLNFFEKVTAIGGITAIWWVQLSTAIISGLAFSTILTLFFIPVMLVAPYNVDRLIRFRKARAADRARAEANAKAAPVAMPAKSDDETWPEQKEPVKGKPGPANDPGKKDAEIKPAAASSKGAASKSKPDLDDRDGDDDPHLFPEAAE
jgi:multidrug efflux pump